MPLAWCQLVFFLEVEATLLSERRRCVRQLLSGFAIAAES